MPDHQPQPNALDAILHGKIVMRPKWQFMLRHIMLGVAIVVVALALVYLGSFIVFLWHTANLAHLTQFGPGGAEFFLREFPWWHLIVILAGIGAFIYLLRRQTHLYRWPLLAILGVFAVAFGLASWATTWTPLHDRLSDRALHGRLPIFGSWYRSQGPLVRGLVTVGTITEVKNTALHLKTDSESVTVKITSSTRTEPLWAPSVGDRVAVIGERDDNTIVAAGIRPLDHIPNRGPFQRPRPEDETPGGHPAY